jgi:hypothetical protein
MRCFLILVFVFFGNGVFAQYTMSNQTVFDCEGTLTDSEANVTNPGWYTHNENYSFTIFPAGAISITINFSLFETEPQNDYVIIYDGPNNTFPILGGPYSGINLPPQITSSGCITIDFVSDVNVAAEGFELSWESQIAIPQPPAISLPSAVGCSLNTLVIELDQNIHCDSVATAQVFVGGQLNQTVNATALNCVNDSTNQVQLSLFPGLNESGTYTISFQSYFQDACDSIWDLTSIFQFIINDCPLEVGLTADNDTLCVGECADLYVNVNGGDATSYSYNWNPTWSNSPGVRTVCPLVTTTYIVTVSDASMAAPQSDTITIVVLNPPVTQAPISICQTAPSINLIANPIGGWWWGTGITSGNNGTFNPNGLAAGIYTVTYGIGGCSDDLDITVLGVNAGPNISACFNTTFNITTSTTTPGGTWSSTCNCVQVNGDITTGNGPSVITAIYTLPNGCSDTLLVTVAGITTQDDDTLCQNSGNYGLTFMPVDGVWSVLPDNPQQPSSCLSPILQFPFQDGFELGLSNWVQDPTNDFDWMVNSGTTPSGGTGPSSAFEGYNYIYTEASSPNNPSKKAAIISPCLNLSAYDNPILHFWFHKQGAGQGSFAVDVSVDNGSTWIWNHWYQAGDLGTLWQEAVIDLSAFNTTEVKVRFRVITGNWQSDVAVDRLSILGGPVTVDGFFLTDVANDGLHNLIYSIQGCDDYVDILVNEINAGSDLVVCPSEAPFNLSGSPLAGVWNGTHITNSIVGTFDPSLGIGIDVVTYTFGGCTDTAKVWVVDTDVQVDTLFLCINEGVQQLDLATVPRTPANGIWTGNGITNPNFPGEFSPQITGEGTHTLTFTANNCSDNLIVKVAPQSVLIDTLICQSSPDIVLNVNPSGGYWIGNGIIDNNQGLYAPSQLSLGLHYVAYTAPNGCVDTFSINIYDLPQLSLSGLNSTYCFKDTNILVSTLPVGGILSGNGINGSYFNPAQAGEGYHTITYAYGSGICTETIDFVVLVSGELLADVYSSEDTICNGDYINIGVNASGGIGNYSFSWDNGLSNSFNHLVNPSISTLYIVSVADGCSDNIVDSIPIFVFPNFSASFSTSTKLCYGELGFAKVNVMPIATYTYEWNTNPVNLTDSIIDFVNKRYEVVITDVITKCELSDTISIPGYDEVDALFFANKTECISMLDGEFQFLDNSIINPAELSQISFWNFGDNSIAPYVFADNPTHIFADTGLFTVELMLANTGGCTDSFAIQVCITADGKIFTPNSFTPNDDYCNDEFYAKGVGGFYSFNIQIHKRWGSEIIFESDKILLTTHAQDGNICSNLENTDPYYKMGSWDGVMLDGNLAPQGVYPFLIEYKQTEGSTPKIIVGHITLIR